MKPTTFGVNNEIEMVLEKYSDMVRRICFLYLKNSQDVEDVFQEVFLKLLKSENSFESEEHEKAWIIRVTINKCKDILKSFWKKNIFSIENAHNVELKFEHKAENELLEVVLALPKKYKDVIYLYYYESYTVPEMAKLLDKKENTIYSNLHRAKKLIKEKLGGKEDEYSF